MHAWAAQKAQMHGTHRDGLVAQLLGVQRGLLEVQRRADNNLHLGVALQVRLEALRGHDEDQLARLHSNRGMLTQRDRGHGAQQAQTVPSTRKHTQTPQHTTATTRTAAREMRSRSVVMRAPPGRPSIHAHNEHGPSMSYSPPRSTADAPASPSACAHTGHVQPSGSRSSGVIAQAPPNPNGAAQRPDAPPQHVAAERGG